MIYEAEVISMIALGGGGEWRLVSRDLLSQAGRAEGEPHMFNPGWGPALQGIPELGEGGGDAAASGSGSPSPARLIKGHTALLIFSLLLKSITTAAGPG